VLPLLEDAPTVPAYPDGLEPLLLVFGQTGPIGCGTLLRNSVVYNLAGGNLIYLAGGRIEDEQDGACLRAAWQLGRQGTYE
jgi:hypothetical protein